MFTFHACITSGLPFVGSFEILEQRLRGRGTEKEEAVLARLSAAKEEMEYGATPGAYDHVIINDDLDIAYEALKKAIFV